MPAKKYQNAGAEFLRRQHNVQTHRPADASHDDKNFSKSQSFSGAVTANFDDKNTWFCVVAFGAFAGYSSTLNRYEIHTTKYRHQSARLR